jgi:metal-dependent amidase/aminoacylase/carboxypeptidase family protein
MNPFDQVVVPFGQVHAGTSYNIFLMSAMIEGTVRCMTGDVRDKGRHQVNEIAESIATEFEMKSDVQISRRYLWLSITLPRLSDSYPWLR